MSECTVCPYRVKGPLRKLSHVAFDHLNPSFRTRRYETGEAVFLQGDAVSEFFFLCGGAVKLVRESPEGKQTIVEVLGPCGWFGEFSFCDEAVHSLTAEALEPVTAKSISQRHMAEFLRKEPELLFEMVERLNVSLRESRAHNADYAHRPVRLRALNLLTSLFARYGRQVNGHWELGLPLARAEIGEMLGVTTETTIRTLAQLQREGHLQLGRRRIYISDPQALRSLSRRESLGPEGASFCSEEK
ncbi:MAG: Crp/Fnr family transcriptional regulator [Nitrospinota bacterium]